MPPIRCTSQNRVRPGSRCIRPSCCSWEHSAARAHRHGGPVRRDFDVGKEADFVVIDPTRTPALNAVITHGVRSDDATMARDQTLFGLLMRTRETSIAGTYVQGRRLQPPPGKAKG